MRARQQEALDALWAQVNVLSVAAHHAGRRGMAWLRGADALGDDAAAAREILRGMAYDLFIERDEAQNKADEAERSAQKLVQP